MLVEEGVAAEVEFVLLVGVEVDSATVPLALVEVDEPGFELTGRSG